MRALTLDMTLYDAHNHLQDRQFNGQVERILREAERIGVSRMVVNGSREEDWNEVAALARQYPTVLPSFGLHPWYIKESSGEWKDNLLSVLQGSPHAIGEVGLDCSGKGSDPVAQEEAFLWQLRVATERQLPLSIHCVKAWGRLYELLRENERPNCGFLLHSYSGPMEMIRSFVKLGAYFSFPGNYAHPKRERQRAAFKEVPFERLLIETDAPYQPPPMDLQDFSLTDSGGHPLNHPGNIRATYSYLAAYLHHPFDELERQLEINFNRLFKV